MTPDHLKDRYGYTYTERLDTQRFQLDTWSKLLRPEVYESTVDLCGAINAPASCSSEAHFVPLGSTLASLITSYDKHPELAEKALMGELVPLSPIHAPGARG